jgi:hypothetical protein
MLIVKWKGTNEPVSLSWNKPRAINSELQRILEAIVISFPVIPLYPESWIAHKFIAAFGGRIVSEPKLEKPDPKLII